MVLLKGKQDNNIFWNKCLMVYKVHVSLFFIYLNISRIPTSMNKSVVFDIFQAYKKS